VYKTLKILNNVILLIYKIDLFQMEMMICIFGFEEAIKRIGFSIFLIVINYHGTTTLCLLLNQKKHVIHDV
jgi:hypothetical protein